jgi:hypothetical protein
MKDRNDVEITVGMTATNVGDGLNKGRVGVVRQVSTNSCMAMSYNCPMAQLASGDWSTSGWSSWLRPSEIAVMPMKQGDRT